MSRIDHFFLRYVTFSSPLVAFLFIWGAIGDPSKLSESSGLKEFFYEGLFWQFMVWIVVSFYLMVKNIASKTFRKNFLQKLTRVKERDEREEKISGEAAKFTFFSSLAVLFLLLFLSIFTMGVGKKTEGLKAGEKPGFITFGINISPLEKEKKQDLNVVWS